MAGWMCPPPSSSWWTAWHGTGGWWRRIGGDSAEAQGRGTPTGFPTTWAIWTPSSGTIPLTSRCAWWATAWAETWPASMPAFGRAGWPAWLRSTLADIRPEQAPGRYEKWLSELSAAVGFRPYPDFDALASRLQSDNPRLLSERAAFLARELGRETPAGEVVMAADPAHRRVNPVLYRRQEALACWRRVTAEVLWLEPEDARLRRRLGVDDGEHERGMACFRHFRREEIARIIETFLLSEGVSPPLSESSP